MDERRAEREYAVGEAADAPLVPWDGRTYYERWLEAQAIPVYREFSISDVRSLVTGWWEELGAEAAFIEMEGAAETNGAYVLRLAPGAPTNWRRRTFEEVFYVLEGEGVTEVRRGDELARCEWQPGSLFTVPVTAEYRHSVNHGAVVYCVTAAPLVMNLFHDDDFVFSCDHDLTKGLPSISAFFAETGQLWSRHGRSYVWETNFVRDCRNIALPDAPSRGANGRILAIQL
jgi:mannose-6-phosphate isomerase-like protein (cupin superfamily)